MIKTIRESVREVRCFQRSVRSAAQISHFFVVNYDVFYHGWRNCERGSSSGDAELTIPVGTVELRSLVPRALLNKSLISNANSCRINAMFFQTALCRLR